MPILAKFLHVRRAELARTLQVAGFAIVIGWGAYTAFSGTEPESAHREIRPAEGDIR